MQTVVPTKRYKGGLSHIDPDLVNSKTMLNHDKNMEYNCEILICKYYSSSSH
jgi:hypothetical protein